MYTGSKLPRLASTTLALGLLGLPWLATAHGYVDHPKARQQICKDDGGYWWPADGTGIPNAACRAAFQESGGYMLSQHHEFSANVPDYYNMSAVQATVADGTLCAGGDSRKSGMNLASPAWRKTTIDLSTTPVLPLRFHATTPHNPSYWEFYLTKADIDPAFAPLQWDDLEMIHSAPNTPVLNGYYEFDVPLPTQRSGYAILFTRWQRQDAVGEGFYNCSDLLLTQGNGTEPQHWFDKGAYVNLQVPVQAGDIAQLRVFDTQGNELLDRSHVIAEHGVADHAWAAELATTINSQYYHLLRIGVQDGDDIVFNPDIAANRAWLNHDGYYYNLDIRAGEQPVDPAPGQCQNHEHHSSPAWPYWPRTDWAGEPSHAEGDDRMRHEGDVWQAMWWTNSVPGSDSSWEWVCHY